MASKPKNHRVQPPLQPVHEEEDQQEHAAASRAAPAAGRSGWRAKEKINFR